MQPQHSIQRKVTMMKHSEMGGRKVPHTDWKEVFLASATVFLAVAVMVLGIPAYALSQGGSAGTLAGVVLDSSGGVLPGVRVVATSRQTGFTQEAITGTSGDWRLSSLPLGM